MSFVAIRRTTHKQIWVHEPGRLLPIQIDQGLEHVLPAIWRLGFKTHFSCQGGADAEAAVLGLDHGYIGFDQLDDAQDLMIHLDLHCPVVREEDLYPDGFVDPTFIPSSLYIEFGDNGISPVKSVIRFKPHRLEEITRRLQES